MHAETENDSYKASHLNVRKTFAKQKVSCGSIESIWLEPMHLQSLKFDRHHFHKATQRAQKSAATSVRVHRLFKSVYY